MYENGSSFLEKPMSLFLSNNNINAAVSSKSAANREEERSHL